MSESMWAPVGSLCHCPGSSPSITAQTWAVPEPVAPSHIQSQARCCSFSQLKSIFPSDLSLSPSWGQLLQKGRTLCTPIPPSSQGSFCGARSHQCNYYLQNSSQKKSQQQTVASPHPLRIWAGESVPAHRKSLPCSLSHGLRVIINPPLIYGLWIGPCLT